MKTPAPHIALVRAAFSEPFQKALERIGCPWKADLEKLGMPAEYVVSPTTLIPERPWHCLIDQLALREDIPDLGLHIGNEVPFSDISSMSSMFRSCETLGELLSTFCLQAPRQSSTRRVDIISGPASIWLRDTGSSLSGDRQSDVQIRLYILLGMIQVVQLALGKSWRPRSIELPFKYNKAIEQSGYLGAENVHFDRAFSAIEVPLEALSATIKLKPAQSRPVTQAQKIHRLAEVPVEFNYSVWQTISSCLTANDCHIENIALLYGVSVRTLQRILAANGASYTDLLEHARREKSRDLVQQGALPLDLVAHELGYSDYSKFSRAFQRWYRETPRQARIRYSSQRPDPDRRQ
jgi:AraC-like DNA-binding protein